MNNPCRKPSGPYLIEPAPHYRRYQREKAAREIFQVGVVVAQQDGAEKAAREIFQRIFLPLEIVSSAVSGYRDELNHLLDAPAIYLGPSK